MSEIKKWDEIKGAVDLEVQKETAKQVQKEHLRIVNYMKFAEMSVEDDYNMIDGVINNGSKEPTHNKPEEKKQEPKHHKKPEKLHKEPEREIG